MTGPLVVQSDRTMLLEVDHDEAEACRAAIAPFAELERSPEHVHTYRLTPLGLWNARAAGLDAEQVVDALIRFSRYPVPNALLLDLAEVMDRYGRLAICDDPVHGLVLRSLDAAVLEEVLRSPKVAPLLGTRIDEGTVVVHGTERGRLKQVLIKVGWPAEDRAGYVGRRARTRSCWRRAPTSGCASTSSRRSKGSSPGAPASSCCPAAQARPPWAWRPWPGRRR